MSTPVDGPSVGIDVRPVNMGDTREMERAIARFARSPNGGLIVTSSALAVAHRDQIVALAARYRLPAVYYRKLFVTAGGLISYGPLLLDQYKHAAGYIDRILKGAKPADLPVQTPARYETVLNLAAARSLGLDIPRIVRVRADEVIN